MGVTPLEAARIGDQIEHSFAMTGLLAGLVVGLIITGALLLAAGATVATGGAAAVVIGGLIAGVAGGGLSGMKIGQMFSSKKGPIITGSPNTFIGGNPKQAARAIVDKVLCADHKLALIATGSTNVYINMQPAARNTDKTVCDGKIAEGYPDVYFGGPTGQYLDIHSEVPGWLVKTLEWAAIIGTVIATGGAILTVGIGAALGGLAAGKIGEIIGGKALGALGGYLFGEKGKVIGEEVGAFLGSTWLGGKGEKLGAKLEARLPPGLRAKLPGNTPEHLAVRAADDYIKNQIPKNDYSLTAGKEPSLWTGEGALDAARKSGHGTMEDTAGGKATEQFVGTIKENSSWNVQKPVWVESSKSYVHEVGKQYGTINPETGMPITGPNAGKEVTVFVSEKANPNSVYFTVEKPLLQSYGVKIKEVPVAVPPTSP
ncbi:MAG TPA: PAAR domain-containing protein [Polyangium sp.]|nr:PAAR domain-containing protein [Polyangium sp.]